MENQSNGRAIASLVLGIAAIALSVLFGFYAVIISLPCGIVGIVLSVKARKEQPSGLATAGFVLSIIGTVWSGIVVAACTCLVGIFSSAANSL